MRKYKKYANGTGAAGYLESPSETMADYNIMLAEAEAMANSNIGLPITAIASQLLTAGLQGVAKSGTPTTGEATPETAANGSSNAQGKINAEGGEIVEPPQGMPVELQGNKHESGGVNVQVPPGTLIFSDRIKKNGKTMADRKKARETKLSNIEKLLVHNDKAIANTAKRTKESLEKEEEQDLALQEMANIFESLQNFAMGTGKKGVQTYANGTGGDGTLTDEDVTNNLVAQYLLRKANNAGNRLNSAIQGTDSIFANEQAQTDSVNKSIANSDAVDDIALGVLGKAPIDPTVEAPAPLSPNADKLDDSMAVTEDVIAPDAPLKRKSNLPSPTAGDVTGLIGNLVSTFGPMKNTLENRAGDTPNINAFKDFGKDALKTNEMQMDYIAGQKASNLNRVNSKAQGSKRALRNSARGINTLRAGDLAVDLGANEADSQVNDQFAKAMFDVLSQKTQLEATQDQVVMTGEQQRDLADRQDRDNFYTQKATDIATMGTGLQQTGKDINDILKNPVYLNLLNEMSKYFNVNAKGELEAKPTT